MFSIHTRDIDLAKLWNTGIRNIVFDLDGTIYPLRFYTGDFITAVKSTIDLMQIARKMGFKVYVISNTKNPSKIYNLPVLDYAVCRTSRTDNKRWKPWRVKEALDNLSICESEFAQTIMVGNNPFNDGLGALLAGIKFCLVLSP